MKRRGVIAAALTVSVLAGIALAITGCDIKTDSEASRRLEDNLGNTSVTMFSTAIRARGITYDDESTIRLAQFVADQGLAQITRSDAQVPLTPGWRRNQAGMLRTSADEFCAYVKANPIQTEFAFLAEYLIRGGGRVGGIHYYIVDSNGGLAAAGLMNSHWPIFKEVDPSNIEECDQALIMKLREELDAA
jgi:hypothetical protein